MKDGDFIHLAYIGKLESGEIFDLTDEAIAKENKIYNPQMKYRPVPVIVGAGFVIKGIDNALRKMNVGDKKEIIVEPEDGFGTRNPELVRTVNEKSFGNKKTFPGMIVDFGDMKGRVQTVSGGRVRVDFNHPLAGKKLIYNIEIIDKIEDKRDQLNAILEFFGINARQEIKGNQAEIEADLPSNTKQTISALIIKHITGIEEVKFIQIFRKREEEA